MIRRDKPQGPKVFRLIKALFQCTILFCIPGMFNTFFSPSFTIELTRVNQDRVDATVIKNLIFIFPVTEHTASDIVGFETNVFDGGTVHEGSGSTRRTVEVEDEGLLLLKGAKDKKLEVWISPKNLNDVKYKVQYFLNESKEPFLRMWVVDNWKFGVILPGGILLLCLIIFFMAAWSIITGKPLEKKVSTQRARSK